MAFLATYCHVYDIICANSAMDLAVELEHLVSRPNERRDVLEYMRSYAALCKQGTQQSATASGCKQTRKTQSIEIPPGMKVTIAIEPAS